MTDTTDTELKRLERKLEMRLVELFFPSMVQRGAIAAILYDLHADLLKWRAGVPR